MSFSVLIEHLKVMSLSDYGSWASIIGTIVTLIAFYMLRSIRKKFLFRSRVEEHCDRLKEISSTITFGLNNYNNNADDVHESICVADVRLKTMKKGASGDLLKYIKSARRKAFLYNVKLKIGYKYKPIASDARSVVTKINVVIAELDNVKRELLVGE